MPESDVQRYWDFIELVDHISPEELGLALKSAVKERASDAPDHPGLSYGADLQFIHNFDIALEHQPSAQVVLTDALLAALLRMERNEPSELPPGVLDSLLNIRKSMDTLGPAMAAAPTIASPQLARSMQAEENRWRSIEDEFGMLTSTEVAELLGAKSSNRSLASHYRNAGKILGVKRLRAFLYPGFQFDYENGDVWDVIPPLIQLSRDKSWSDESLTLWICAATGYLDDERPVDHLDEPELVLTAARSKFQSE